MTMKVCLVTSEFPPVIGGIASHVYELARALVAEAADVTIVHPLSFGSTLGEVVLQGAKIYRPRLIKAQPFYTVMLKFWLANAIRARDFDIIHVHGIRPLAATRGLKVPVIFTNHSSGFLARLKAGGFRRQRTANLLKGVKSVLEPSDELVDAVRAFGFAGPAQMIPNGVDTTRFFPSSSLLRAKCGIGENETVLLLARRLVEKNGVIWFARAIAEMRHLPFRVVVAGDGVDRELMTQILRAANMLDRVIFLGGVPNSDMPNVYNAADICVLPSLAEATSITGLEAMACGLPLVGTNVGGIPTLLEDGITGLLVPPREPKAMAQALGQLIAEPALRRQMGAAARHSVEQNFSWPGIARRTLEAYRQCLAS